MEPIPGWPENPPGTIAPQGAGANTPFPDEGRFPTYGPGDPAYYGGGAGGQAAILVFAGPPPPAPPSSRGVENLGTGLAHDPSVNDIPPFPKLTKDDFTHQSVAQTNNPGTVRDTDHPAFHPAEHFGRYLNPETGRVMEHGLDVETEYPITSGNYPGLPDPGTPPWEKEPDTLSGVHLWNYLTRGPSVPYGIPEPPIRMIPGQDWDQEG